MGTNYTTLAADYYVGGQHEHAYVVIYTIVDGRRNPALQRIDVSGKREARTVAAEYGATPWNF